MDQNPKQQVAEKLRSSANVLVTVSKNPSVDQLAAAIGLSLMLDALGKHTATVFSGQIPDILSFLEPEKTFDNTVDSLRDFIIALDKDKADKLRYKVEDDVVKVYITPYRSKITEKDLTFTHGDFNVDVVIALGVKKKADLDEAITAHGRILHDAAVVAVNAGEVGGDVGAIDWTDPNANSLCEMLVSISEALEGGVLDAAMSTAFLTGIVSVTERFSNANTTPKLMTMAAQLMAAGANQQLISKELQFGGSSALDLSDQSGGSSEKPKDSSTLDLHDDKKKSKKDKKPKDKIEEIKENIDDDIKLDELERQLQEATDDVAKDEAEEKEETTEFSSPEFDIPRDSDPEPVIPDPAPAAPVPDLSLELPKVEPKNSGGPLGDAPLSPSLGGTFNATSEEALQAKQNEQKDGFNDEILSHSVQPLGSQAPQPAPGPAPMPDAAQQQMDVEASLEEARRAVEQAAMQTPYNPSGQPLESINAQPMSMDVPQQLNHDPMQMPQPMAPPATPPPFPPQMPQPQMQQPMPQPQPAYDPNMANQTFNIPGQPMPQQQYPQQPQPQPQMQAPQQPWPPQQVMPPAPADMSQLPPAPPQ